MINAVPTIHTNNHTQIKNQMHNKQFQQVLAVNNSNDLIQISRNKTIQSFRQFIKDHFIENISPVQINIFIFGPTGSGKSSLIRTFYQSVNCLSQLPESIKQLLVISKLTANEGTKKFTEIVLQNSKSVNIKDQNKIYKVESNQINVYDTRGQVFMDEREQYQFETILSGKVKNMGDVQQRNFRYAYLLWEFWKKDNELFPNDLFEKDKKVLPQSIILVFDGSADEIPNGEEETQFYRQILSKLRQKKYYNPQIVLTRVDKVEMRIKKRPDYTDELLNEIIDKKIDEVAFKLAVPRHTVHFIENYNERHNNLENQDSLIEYYALKLLKQSIETAEQYIKEERKTKIQQNNDICNIY